jgi:signal peptidase
MASALALLVLIVVLLAGTVPALFGAESFVVYTGSMQPAINVGDLVVVRPTSADQLRDGDVITYRTTLNPDILVTHRIVGTGTDNQGGRTFLTKGDASDSVDTVPVASGAVLGKVAYNIPWIGYLVEFSRTAQGKLVLIGVPGLLLVLDYLLSLRKKRGSVPVTQAQSEAGELLARGRVAQANGGVNAAMGLFDRAIAVDPHLDQAWLLKAACLPEGQERLACLRAGLTVNPSSVALREALGREAAAGSVAG